ncbi:MAG TPA: RICIN domain-containing protein [Mobilitalea sp.]|nr:RICIN domain-containing protein [Mobilitalea sp.]
MFKSSKVFFRLLFALVFIINVICFGYADINWGGATNVSAATNSIKGVNWADPSDNFKTGVLYVSGLSSTDTYSSAATVADKVISQFMTLTGSNTVRMPINEATVSSYWSTYTGAIDTALSKGKVILCYWAASGGAPANMTNYWSMWNTVTSKYGSNSNCYFEPMNEPYGYTAANLCTLYETWVSTYSSITKSRIILDGSGYAENLSTVGADTNLSSCLLGVHDYAYWTSYSTEGGWQNDLATRVGSYSSRVVMTEWGAPMTTGVNYNQTSSANEVCYIRGISNQLRAWSAGSCYWPGLRDGDSYSLTTKTGSGSGITLTLNNTSGLDRLKYAWGDENIKIKNAATSMYLDGYGYTTDGTNAMQYASSSSTNQQWVIEGTGSTYVRIKNIATGLYLDGLGYTTNGSVAGQWSGTSSYNQQWTQEISGNYVMFKNRNTGLYLDGLGYTTNGSVCGQWSGTSNSNQKWSILVP